MKALPHTALAIVSFAFAACHTAETAATGTANTVGHAAQGMGRTARTLGTGAVNTIDNTATTAGSGVAEKDVNKATVGTVKTAGTGVGSTAVDSGRSHVKTSSGVLKDTGKTVTNTAEAAEKE